MAKTDIAWTGNCKDCINVTGPNGSDRWVELSCCNGKKDNNGELVGTGSTDISVSSSPATFYGQKSECTVTFTSENGDRTQCQVIRCPYVCSCGSYDITPKNTSIGSGGFTGTLFTIESPYGCPIDGRVFEVSSNSSNVKNLKIGPQSNNLYNGHTSANVTGEILKNDGNGTNISIEVKHNDSNVICKTISLGQSGVECDCATFDIANDSKSFTSVNNMGGTKDVNVNINNTACNTRMDIQLVCEVDWITVTKNSNNNFTLNISARNALEGESAYTDTREARLYATYQINGGPVEPCTGNTVYVSQLPASCSCDDVNQTGTTKGKTLSVDKTGRTDSTIGEYRFEVPCVAAVSAVVLKNKEKGDNDSDNIYTGATATTEISSNREYCTIRLKVAPNNEAITKEFYIVPKIGNANYCSDYSIKVTQEAGVTCAGAEINLFGEGSEENTFNIGNEINKTILLAKIKRPEINGKKSGNVEKSSNADWLKPYFGNTGETGDGYVTLSIHVNKGGEDTSPCEDGNQPRTGTIEVWISQESGGGECIRKQIKVIQECEEEEQECNVTLTVDEVTDSNGAPKTDGQLDCEGGKVKFKIE